jgi:hypothetical protein
MFILFIMILLRKKICKNAHFSDTSNMKKIANGTPVIMGTVIRDDTGVKTCHVERTIHHPNWHRETRTHDIALVKLDCWVDTTDRIRPITLAKSNDQLFCVGDLGCNR